MKSNPLKDQLVSRCVAITRKISFGISFDIELVSAIASFTTGSSRWKTARDEIEDERRYIATSRYNRGKILILWILDSSSWPWRYGGPPRIPQNPLEAVNLSVGRPIPVDIPDFINSSFAGLHSAY